MERYLRVSRASIETAIVTYESPGRGQIVKLVGMIHVAEREYYEQILAEICADERARHRILYEEVSLPASSEEAEMSPAERSLLEAIKFYGLLQYLITEVTGATHQMMKLAPRDTWVHGDVTARELISLLMSDEVVYRFVSAVGLLETLACLSGEIRLGKIPSSLIRLTYASALLATPFVFPSVNQYLASIILDQRNMIAFEHILGALEHNNRVTAIWGMGHLPGIDSLLRKKGFTVTRVEWRLAFKSPSFLVRKLVQS
jgi:hypothetical protein